MMGLGKIKQALHSSSDAIDPEGQRLLALTLETDEPIFGPFGHSLLLSANGGGKTTRGAMPWLFSLAASEPNKAILVLDSKNGELAIQAARMLADMGRKVAVIDDMGVWPELEPYHIQLNSFGAVVAAHNRDPRDVIFANETVTNTVLPEPAGGPDKNKHFRDVPKEIIEFCNTLMLARNPNLATPGAAATILNNPDMLKSFAEIEAQEGSPMLQAQANTVLEMATTDNWGQHLSEARRSLRLFGPGTRLHEAGRDAKLSHADLIREDYIIFLIGPQAYINRLGNYYALHLMSFCDALYQGAGSLRAICDEFTNTPLKSLVESLTTLRAFGAEIHMIAQSRSEIIRKFGEQETRTIEENAIVKQWFGFSSFEEAERVSKAMGDEHAVSSSLGGDSQGSKTQSTLNLTKQRIYTPSELMQMKPTEQLIHIKGVGFFMARTISQENIAPYCNLLAENPLEGGRLKPDPRITLVTPQVTS